MRWLAVAVLVAGLFGETPPPDRVKIHYNGPATLSPQVAQEIGKELRQVWKSIPTEEGEFVVLDLEYNNGVLNGKVVQSNLPPEKLKELIGKLKELKFPAPFKIRVKFTGEPPSPEVELGNLVQRVWEQIKLKEGEVELRFLPNPGHPPKIEVLKSSIPEGVLKKLIGELKKLQFPKLEKPVQFLLFRVAGKGEIKVVEQGSGEGGKGGAVGGEGRGGNEKGENRLGQKPAGGEPSTGTPQNLTQERGEGKKGGEPQASHPTPGGTPQKPQPAQPQGPTPNREEPQSQPQPPHPTPAEPSKNPQKGAGPHPGTPPHPQQQGAPSQKGPAPKPPTPKPPALQNPHRDKNKEVEKILAKFRELDRKVEELLHYNFKLDNFDLMETPFWRPPKKVDTEVKKEPIISYRYDVISILNDSVRLKVVKYKGDQPVKTIDGWFKEGDRVGNCKIGKIDFDNSKVTLICGGKKVVKSLLPAEIQIKVE